MVLTIATRLYDLTAGLECPLAERRLNGVGARRPTAS